MPRHGCDPNRPHAAAKATSDQGVAAAGSSEAVDPAVRRALLLARQISDGAAAAAAAAQQQPAHPATQPLVQPPVQTVAPIAALQPVTNLSVQPQPRR